MRIFQALALALAAMGCQAGEGEQAMTPATGEYRLTELDGAPFTARATIAFPAPDRVTGMAPCNRYFATQTARHPAFSLIRIGGTRRACAELDAERRFLTALRAMTRIEVAGDTVVLTNEAGRRMVFSAP